MFCRTQAAKTHDNRVIAFLFYYSRKIFKRNQSLQSSYRYVSQTGYIGLKAAHMCVFGTSTPSVLIAVSLYVGAAYRYKKLQQQSQYQYPYHLMPFFHSGSIQLCTGV